MKTQAQPNRAVAARLGSSHGYRFDGDTVFLNASFVADSAADTGRSWSLRLLAGADHVIAEVALPPLSELTGAVENYETSAIAAYPATRGFHAITLALVARDTTGNVEQHDAFTYELAQAFAQPRLSGPVGLWFESNRELVLDIDHIENNRAEDNLSGSLSVEVWALDQAYTGGAFTGQCVAGAALGQLAGGQSWTPGALHLAAVKPANARAHLVVMLREWNGSAYETRDFITFAPPPPVATSASEPTSAPVATSASESNAPTPQVSALRSQVSSAPAADSVVTKAVKTVKTALAAVTSKTAAKPKAPAKPKAEKPATKPKKKSSK